MCAKSDNPMKGANIEGHTKCSNMKLPNSLKNNNNLRSFIYYVTKNIYANKNLCTVVGIVNISAT